MNVERHSVSSSRVGSIGLILLVGGGDGLYNFCESMPNVDRPAAGPVGRIAVAIGSGDCFDAASTGALKKITVRPTEKAMGLY